MALRDLSLRLKLVVALLTVGVLAVAITGWESYRRSRSALEAAAVNQLTAIREERRRAVETYFARLRLETITLAETRLASEAMRRFAAAWNELEGEASRLSPALLAESRSRLEAYYREHLAPYLHGLDERPVPTVESLVPADPAAVVLQLLYVVADAARGDAAGLERPALARAASAYQAAAAALDPPLRRLTERLGYHDLYLIEGQTGRIVWSVEREVDLGTSLLTGPYRETNLAQAFRAARDAADPTAVALVDFELYVPSRSEPNAFMAAPTTAGGERIGILAVELPIAPVDAMMTGGQTWRAGGLGRTGETYLVGPDQRMRSNSRFFLEHPEAYLRRLAALGIPETERRLIRAHRSTILFEQVSSPAVESVLAGATGSTTARDYRGVPVIASYAPVEVPGLRWGLVAKIDTAEALAPAVALRNAVAVTGAAIAALVAGLAIALGASLTRPLARLMDGMRRLGRGHLGLRVPIDRRDEVGQIAAAFNQMADDLQETTVSRDYVHNILSSMTDAVIVVRPPAEAADNWRDAVVVTVNPSACALIGRAEGDIVGQRIRDIIPEIATAGEGSRRAALWLEEVVRAGSIGGREAVYRIVDGREVPVLFSSAVMREERAGRGAGVVWAAQDLTEMKKLQARNAFIRETFGRYVSDDVVAALLSAPEALRLGGETRTVTIVMSDLRGFTALAERLTPEEVVSFLNAYFERMVEPIFRYQGTINEIMGDGILMIFGAPTSGPDDAERGVACAVEMQIAMRRFGGERRAQGLPTVEMGIGLHTGPVVLGNIGSERRAKYAAVGTTVNLAARIESYTTGGQILISEETFRAVNAPLQVNGRLRIEPKGARGPLTVHDIAGIGGRYALHVDSGDEDLVALPAPVPVRYAILEEKHVGGRVLDGSVVRLSRQGAEIAGAQAVEFLSNVKVWLLDARGQPGAGDLYAKVVDGASGPGAFRVRFTSLPPEVLAQFEAVLSQALPPGAIGP